MADTPSEIQKVDAAPLAKVKAGTLAPQPDVLATLIGAIKDGLKPDEIRAIGELIKEAEERQAKRDFFSALAAFQAECPPIPRSKSADFPTNDGRMQYSYAELDVILQFIRPYLQKHELGVRWSKAETTDKNAVHVTCHVFRGGHSEPTESADFPIDQTKGGKSLSAEQRVSRTETTAKRRSLALALGFSLCPDTDGNHPTEPVETITAAQAKGIETLLQDLRSLDAVEGTRERMLGYLQVEEVAEIPASRYTWVMDSIARKMQDAKREA